MGDIVAITAQLSNHETFIRKHIENTWEVIDRLAEIRDRKLYKVKCNSWAVYLNDCWRGVFSKSHVDRLIGVARMRRELAAGGTKEVQVTHRQAKRLGKLPKNHQVAAYEKAAKVAYQRYLKEEAELAKQRDEPAPKPRKPKQPPAPTTKELDEAVKEIESQQLPQIDLIKAAARDFESLRKLASSLELQVEQLAHSPWGDALAHGTQEIHVAVEQIRSVLLTSSPYCECCFCGHKKKCDVCKGRGWISRAQFRNAPKAMQDKVKEHA